MVKPDLLHTRSNLFFHHFILCNAIPLFNGRPILDPALIDAQAGGDAVANLSDCVGAANGVDLRCEDEFVLKDVGALDAISEHFRYVFFVVSDLIYQSDLPSFFSDEWDPLLCLSEMQLLGWTVYAFSEPAIFFGCYPIKINGDTAAIDENYINEWGLIRNKVLADEIAKKNNEPEDENKGHWRPLGIYADKKTYIRLRSAA